MEPEPVPYTPCVLTSEVYNDAETVFTMLQNKEQLISLLDCTTVLRAMGMNPTGDDLDRLKMRMSEPVLLLEQWRREEELKREKERRKEEARERRGTGRSSMAATRPGSKVGGRKSVVDKAVEDSEKPPVKIVPAEEIKNIDWNIFIHCTEEMYRDAPTEQQEVLKALHVFNMGGPAKLAGEAAAPQTDAADALDELVASAGDDAGAAWVAEKGKMTPEELVAILTTHGENVLTPSEVKQLKSALPSGSPSIDFSELAARLQGTYRPPTQEELDLIAAAELADLEAQRQREEAEKQSADDPLAGL